MVKDMNNDLNKLLELIDSVKSRNDYNCEVELIGSKESFDKLTEIGFDLNSVRHQETLIDDSKIFIIPTTPKSLKVYFED